MDEIMEMLKKAKDQELRDDPCVVDTLNQALAMCGKMKDVIDAMMNPVPGQEELLPEEKSGTVINSEYVTFNYFFNDPPTDKNYS